MDNLKLYDYYNREERAICAHLFRLLHEKLENKLMSPLGQFIKLLFQSDLEFRNGTCSFKDLRFENIAIYCETAILRDAYENAKPNVNELMDGITKILMKQQNITDCKLYSGLDNRLNDINKTHPKQIRHKAEKLGIQLAESESIVFQAMQEIFNAKPDLVITIDNILLVCEAKHTQKFAKDQIRRTWNIAEVWSTLLYKDLGFSAPPVYSVFTLGDSDKRFTPNIKWSDVLGITEKTYGPTDRTLIAIKAGAEHLSRIRKS